MLTRSALRCSRTVQYVKNPAQAAITNAEKVTRARKATASGAFSAALRGRRVLPEQRRIAPAQGSARARLCGSRRDRRLAQIVLRHRPSERNAFAGIFLQHLAVGRDRFREGFVVNSLGRLWCSALTQARSGYGDGSTRFTWPRHLAAAPSVHLPELSPGAAAGGMTSLLWPCFSSPQVL
jgi:hypothetical protein